MELLLASTNRPKLEELSAMLGDNAIACYDLDPAPLREIADRIGPEKSLFVEAAE